MTAIEYNALRAKLWYFRLQVFTLWRSEPPDRENLQPK